MDIKEYIKANFVYNSTTGVIKRFDRAKSNGSFDRYGYLIIKVKGKQYKAHRIAWLLYYGDFPNGNIDHINRDKSDNRISNLRIASYAVNNNNAKRTPNKDTGEIGICLDGTDGLKKKYVVSLNCKLHRFYTIEEAKLFRIKHNKQT